MANAFPLNSPAQPADELIQLVSFKLDKEEFGVEVLKVREIIRMTTINHMPDTPRYVEGIINLRGKVIPIISMREKFGLEGIACDKETRIMVMSVGDNLMGFRVDAVSEVIRIASSQIQPSPLMVNGANGQPCVTGVVNRADRLLVMLDPDKMFSTDEQRHL